MPSRELTNLILALLHSVASPRHHRRSRCGGRRHCHPVPASAPPQPPSATPRPHVMEWPPIGRRVSRWNLQTLTPLHGVDGAGRVPSTVGGLATTGLHQRTDHLHRVVRGRMRERKKKMMPTASRWSPALLGRW
jgi:hypothetical protein